MACACRCRPRSVRQTVTFQVTNNTNTALFSVQPAIAPNGTLTYTPAPNANGSATVTVRVDRQRRHHLRRHRHAAHRRPSRSPSRLLNDVPSFTKGGDQGLAHSYRGCRSADRRELGHQHQRRSAERTNGLCVPLSAAACQQTVTFHVTNNNNALFAAQPAIAAGRHLDLHTGTRTRTAPRLSPSDDRQRRHG